MKVYVSYVIQNKNSHSHQAEIVDVKTPPVSYSPDPPVLAIMDWAKEKQRNMTHEDNMIITSIYKI